MASREIFLNPFDLNPITNRFDVGRQWVICFFLSFFPIKIDVNLALCNTQQRY